jgi:WD40 repeat protein/transcriptional regulator with XRE-family HTH domain
MCAEVLNRDRFSGLLLRCRGRTGLTQRQLAERAGVSMRTVQGWETGLMYPGPTRLEALLAALLAAHGFAPGRELAEAEELWEAVAREAPRAHPPFEPTWFAALLVDGGGPAQGNRPEVAAMRRQDWGDAPAVADFVGREGELATISTWVVRDRSRLLAVLGMGGIGKTSMTARIAHDLASAFEFVYWRGLRNAPPVSEWLAGAVGFLSGQQQALAEGESNQIAMLLALLRERPCLVVLDNFETVMEPGQREGRYRESFAGYGSVLRSVGETSHQSCLMITSREAPPDWATLSSGAVQTLELGGLDAQAGQSLLAHKHLLGDDQEWADLIGRYGGNGLALKVVGESIRKVFGGDIRSFLSETSSGTVFGGIKRLLAEQIERSSALEQEVLHALAVGREPVTVSELMSDLGPRVGRGALVESVEALRRRSLVDRAETAGAPAFTLQSVVLEYLTDRVVEQVCDEIRLAQPRLLVTLPLIRAQAREYVRTSQERLIGDSILQQLKTQHGAAGTEQLLLALLAFWRRQAQSDQGFGPGNAVNLLRLLRGDLRGLDLSGLALKQSYLAGVDAQDSRLSDADLSYAVLTEAFSFPLSVALSGDGSLLVAGTSGGELCVWRVADRTPLFVLQAHAGPIHRVAVSEDMRLLASASEDGTVALWDVSTGEGVATLAGHASPVYAMAMDTSAGLLASGSFDGAIHLWSLRDRRLIATLQGHTSPVWTVSMSADGRVLASGSFDGSIQLWDVQSRSQRLILTSERSPVWSLRLSEDGALLASGSEDGRVRLWDARDGVLRLSLHGHTGSVRGVALSADGKLLASASWDRTVRLWETADGQALAMLEGHTGPVRGVALSRDGRTLASGSLDGSVRLWDSPEGRPLATMEGHTTPVYGVALSADGRLLASGHWDGTVVLWDVLTGEALHRLEGHGSPVYGVALSADGDYVASASWDRTIRCWRTSTGERLSTLFGHTGGVRSVALSADGSLLASASWDATVRLWRPKDGQSVTTLHGHRGGVRSVALGATADVVVSGGLDGTVRLWRVADGQPVATLQRAEHPVYCVASTATSDLVASGRWDGSLDLWDPNLAEPRVTIAGHTGEVRGVAMSADGSLVASCGFDGSVRLWDERGAPLGMLEGHTHPVYGVAMSHDGAVLASGSFDGTVRIWDVHRATCERILRSDRPFERADITGLTGVTSAQRAALRTLGAVEREPSRWDR